jgi:choline-sulfatase
MILKGPDVPVGRTVTTPVSLVDIYPTLLDMVDLEQGPEEDGLPGASLLPIANAATDDQRIIFSEYHGAGAISGLYMIRQGPWKYVHYTSYSPELFNLADDPEEVDNRANDPGQARRLAAMEAVLRTIVDPEAVDARAKSDQAAHVENHGGRSAILADAPIHGSPVPGGESTRVR